jgi:hypothetical protein
MLAVARGLEAAGCAVTLAGGGPGTKFVADNGYDEFEPTTVDFVGDYQRDRGLAAVLTGSVPALLTRVREYRAWLAAADPDLFVTDDVTAALAAALARRRYVYVSHDPHEFYDTPVERAGAWLRNLLPRVTATAYLLPKVWDGEPTVPGATAVPPLAPRADGVEDGVDVLVVPSAFSVAPERLTAAIEARGRTVTLVGGDDWETVPSLQPYVAGATLVVCSGYSTVMEAAVAGTPCVVVPSTSEQRGVAAAVADRPGFYRADTVTALGAVLDGRLEAPDPQPNGVESVVTTVRRLLALTPGSASASESVVSR